jgi:hypothetical protein
MKGKKDVDASLEALVLEGQKVDIEGINATLAALRTAIAALNDSFRVLRGIDTSSPAAVNAGVRASRGAIEAASEVLSAAAKQCVESCDAIPKDVRKRVTTLRFAELKGQPTDKVVAVMQAAGDLTAWRRAARSVMHRIIELQAARHQLLEEGARLRAAARHKREKDEKDRAWRKLGATAQSMANAGAERDEILDRLARKSGRKRSTIEKHPAVKLNLPGSRTRRKAVKR